MVVALAVPATPSASAAPPDPSDLAAAALRTACDLQWVAGVCEAVAYPDPGYRADVDPSPDAPLALRVGAVHEHSGYSDGDPESIPADYFAAGREGHNRGDGGGDYGVVVDFVMSSEHSENERLPLTLGYECLDFDGDLGALAELDIEGVVPPLSCAHLDEADHYRKWIDTLAQAAAAGDEDFTAMRGFEWTNDYYNHLGVYFSRNVVNAKVDGSYLTMELMWNWLRKPAERGGGSDALVVFNHPGELPALTPFDGDLPHNQLFGDVLGGANWNDLAHVPDVDPQVVGIEVNGGDDLMWYLEALTKGWHLGPVAAEDEHQREWAASTKGKTLVLTRGRSAQDYYFAFQQHRTVAVSDALISGEPGSPAVHPSALFHADGTSIQDPAAHPMGSTVEAAGEHTLHVELDGLAPGAPVALVSNALDAPEAIGPADAGGSLRAARTVTTPAAGEHWWFVVACPVGTLECGSSPTTDLVTAPIWFRSPGSLVGAPVVGPQAAVAATGAAAPGEPAAPAPVAAAPTAATARALDGAPATPAHLALPATGARQAGTWVFALLAAGLGLLRRTRTPA
jgi:hypothetical protein